MGSPIVWLEMRTADVDKAREFYGTLFGWTFTPSDFADGYWVISTTEGTASGGMVEGEISGDADVTFYVAVEELEPAVHMATALGAEVEEDPSEISAQAGWYAILRDPVGARFGLWSPNP